MAQIDTTKRTDRANTLLGKLYRTSAGVQSLEQIIAAMPDRPEKSIFDGMVKYSRSKFNRMGSCKEQDAYMDRLKAMRIYCVGDMVVPKTIYDLVDGVMTHDIHEGMTQ